MAETKIMTLAAQQYYDEKIKAHIADEDAKLLDKIETHVHSWNDLQDRPFYYREEILETIAENITVDAGSIYLNLPEDYRYYFWSDKAGQEYKVILNGETYYATLVDYTSGPPKCALGNTAMYMSGEPDTGHPFVIIRDQTSNYLKTTDDSIERTVSIYHVNLQLKQLDEKFIPDTIARVSDIENIDLTPYETKTDAAAKLDEAKTFASEEDAKVQGVVDALSGKVTTLIGEDDNKSIRTIANEELAKQLVAEGAKESLDTLTEIAAWIQSHPDDASAMNKAIGGLEALVGALPDGVAATTVIGYVQEVVAAEKARAEGIEAGLEGRLTDVEDAVGTVDSRIATAKQETIDEAASDATTKANKALEDAKTYADGKAAANKELIDTNAEAIDGLAAIATSGSWNDLEDKPFYSDETIFAHVENFEAGRTYGEDGSYYATSLEATELPESVSSLVGANVSATINGTQINGVLKEVTYYFDYWLSDRTSVAMGNLHLLNNKSDSLVDTGEDWCICVDVGEHYPYDHAVRFTVYSRQVSSVTIESLTCFAGGNTKTLDEKFIPDTIARVSDIPEGFSGSWNDLTDKPFGEEETETVLFDVENNADYISGISCQDEVWSNAKNVRVYGSSSNIGDFVIDCGALDMGGINVVDESKNINFRIEIQIPGSLCIIYADGSEKIDGSLKAVDLVRTSIKTLDSKFIGDDIARVSDQTAIANRVTTAETAISALETKVGDGFCEITNEEIDAMFA